MKPNVVTCDRCGERCEACYFDFEVKRFENTDQTNSSREYQLCVKCFDSLFRSVKYSNK